MLDVHPPHNPTHTWRDFFIHIATICIGLLIAIGLEQSVEALHHRHQRLQLEENLRAETEINQQVIRNDVAILDADLDQVSTRHAAVRAAKAAPEIPASFHPSVPSRSLPPFVVPSGAVWNVATHSMTAGLLSREQAQANDRLAVLRDRFTEPYLAHLVAVRNLRAFELRFAQPADPPSRVLTLIPNAELASYDVLLTQVEAQELGEEAILLACYGANRLVLTGHSSQQELNQHYQDFVKQLWNGASNGPQTQPSEIRPYL